MEALFALHDGDPKQELVDGQPVAAERLYAGRLLDELGQFAPGASELLRLAANAQHLQRWALPRSEYPMGLAGYNAWRREQKKRHGVLVARVMGESGYGEQDCDRVEALVNKRALKQDAECQVLEDVVCLVFLQFELEAFAVKHGDDKVVNILQKTWGKMSARAHARALQLVTGLPEGLRALVQQAVG